MGHWILFGKRWPRRYAAPRILSWPMDPRNLAVHGHASGRVVLPGDRPPSGGVAMVVDAWPRAPFWDAVIDLSARPDQHDRGAAARSKLAMQGVGLADEHLAREIIGRLLAESETEPGQLLQPIWTLFDSLSPGDLSQRIEALSDAVVAEHLPPGWDLRRYHREVAIAAVEQAGRSRQVDRADRARRAGVTWAEYWQACALVGLPIGPDGEPLHPERDPSDALLMCCGLVWEAGWRGGANDLDAYCDSAGIVRSIALRAAILAAWDTFVEWSPADRADQAQRARRPPERSKTSPPILRPGHLLRLAWEARRSRWLRREPDYFQDACDRVGVRDDRQMRETIGRNWRRLDPGFFRMADPTIGPPPRPAYP